MVLGISRHTNVGIVRERAAVFEKAAMPMHQENRPTDVLGHAARNEEATTQIQKLQAQLDIERAERKAQAKAIKEAERMAKHWEQEAKAKAVEAERAQSKNYGRAKYADLREERTAKQAAQMEKVRAAQRACDKKNTYRKATATEEYLASRNVKNLHAPSTPSREFPGTRSKSTRDYLKFKRTTGMSASMTPCRDGSITPWKLNTPRTQVTSVQRMGSVSRDSW